MTDKEFEPHEGAQATYYADALGLSDVIIIIGNAQYDAIRHVVDRLRGSCSVTVVNDIKTLSPWAAIDIDTSPRIGQADGSPKRKALLAQYERAKMRRDKNAMRDLARQLERTW